MKLFAAIVMVGIILFTRQADCLALTILPHDGYARVEILGASTNVVVYQYEVSGTGGWSVECADPHRNTVLWGFRSERKVLGVSAPVTTNVNLVVSSRLLSLDTSTGHTNSVLDMLGLDWPECASDSRYAKLTARWADTKEYPEIHADLEYARRALCTYWIPLFTKHQSLILREIYDDYPMLDWVMLQPGESDHVIASGREKPVALLSESYLSYNSTKRQLVVSHLNDLNATPRLYDVPSPHGLSIHTVGDSFSKASISISNNYSPLRRAHLACIYSGKDSCLVYDERTNRLQMITPLTHLESGSIVWLGASDWVIRHTQCTAEKHIFEIMSSEGKLISSCSVPKTADHCHFRFRGVTADNQALFVEHTPATRYGEVGGERLRAFVLSLPAGKIVALHTLDGPASASDISYGLPDAGIVVVGFGERPIIEKMSVDELVHSFWLRAFDIYTGEEKWTHEVPVVIKKR